MVWSVHGHSALPIRLPGHGPSCSSQPHQKGKASRVVDPAGHWLLHPPKSWSRAKTKQNASQIQQTSGSLPPSFCPKPCLS